LALPINWYAPHKVEVAPKAENSQKSESFLAMTRTLRSCASLGVRDIAGRKKTKAIAKYWSSVFTGHHLDLTLHFCIPLPHGRSSLWKFGVF